MTNGLNGFDEHLDNYGDPAPSDELAPLAFAVEEDDSDLRRYKRIHRAGCSNLIDPERIRAVDLDDLADQADAYGVTEVPGDVEGVKAAMAPCAIDLLIHNGRIK